MKNLKLAIFLLFAGVSFAQTNTTILKKKLISNWSELPFYEKITEKKDGIYQWKENYKYLDSININAITYLSDGLKVNGFLVEPKAKGKYPCIIYNRGGNRDMGALNIGAATITLGKIAKEGYVVIASQYRGNGGSEGKEEFGGKDVNDVLNLIPALEDVEKADTQKIGMYGWSRGGMMTYIALTKTNKIKAAAVGGAVSDYFKAIESRPQMEMRVYGELIPNYTQNKTEELTKRSAIKWADKFSKEVPILMLHGASDWRVKPENSLQLALEFNQHRIPYRLLLFEGGDHGVSEHKEEANAQIISWFNRFLKNNEPVPNMEYHGR